MGGSRFATGPDPLYTPRMPPAIYETVKQRCRDVLSELFERVGSPIEGPGKLDHGDIDMLVAVPKGAMASALAGKDESSDETADEGNSPSDNDEISNAWEIIAAALGAVRMAKEQDRAANLAVPWPDDLEPEHDDDDDDGVDDSGTTTAKKYIQVDVRICASVQELDWMLFKHAHGDIWNLLGSTIRPYGLTIDETALSIRVPEIERSNKRLARVELSRDPAAVLAFLGLRRDGFWDRPFASLDAMFEYAATCRLFWVRPPAAAADSSPGDSLTTTTTARLAGLVGSDEGRAGLKANDRKRMATRPAFRAWQDEFIPACRAAGRFAPDPPSLTVDEVAARVRREAFAAFPGVREVFEARRDEFVAGRQREDITKAVRSIVPRNLDPWLRGRTVSALKKIVLLGDDDGFGVAPDFAVRDDRGFWDVEKVVGWVEDHWEDVLGAQIPMTAAAAAAAAAEDKDGRCLARRE